MKIWGIDTYSTWYQNNVQSVQQTEETTDTTDTTQISSLLGTVMSSNSEGDTFMISNMDADMQSAMAGQYAPPPPPPPFSGGDSKQAATDSDSIVSLSSMQMQPMMATDIGSSDESNASDLMAGQFAPPPPPPANAGPGGNANTQTGNENTETVTEVVA